MISDVRWILLVVAGIGVVLNIVMLKRLNHDVQIARDELLLDDERAAALSMRRWQSFLMLVISAAVAASAFYEAGSIQARWLILIAAIAVDWKSWRLFGDRMKADRIVSERLKREKE